MKKLLAILLAMLMLVSCFTLFACDNGNSGNNNVDPNTPSEDTPDEPTEEDMKVTLSDATLDIPANAKEICNNTTFTIFAPLPNGVDRFIAEEPNGTPVVDAIYNRNLAVMDELGITIAGTMMNHYTNDQAQGIIDDKISGTHSFDVAAIHTTSACAALIMADAALSFDYLTYCDLSKPWWNQGLQEAASIFGQNFFATGSICKDIYTYPSCLLFNKDLAEENDLPDLYELVRNGEWTIDKLIEVTKNFSQDLDGDGLVSLPGDLVAITSDDYAFMNFWYGAFRQSTVEKGENEQPTIVADSARMTTVIEKLNTLFNTGRRGHIYPMKERYKGDPYITAFAEGRVLFYVGSLNSATWIREYDINFGIIPLPKLDSNQEKYGAWMDPWHLTLTVPADHREPEKCSIILETLAYHSYHKVYPAVVEQTIFGTGTRDTESLEMIQEYIYPNTFFDFGYLFDSNGIGYSHLIKELVPYNSTDIASFIAGRRATVETHFADLYDKMLEISAS